MYRIAILSTALLTVALAGCSSSSSNPPAAAPPSVAGAASSVSAPAKAPAGCHADITPQICVTVAITGAETVAGTAQTTAPVPPDASPKTTCAQLATWKDTEMDLGGNVSGVGGHTVQWDEDLGNFHGPGRYDLTSSGFYVTVDGAGFQAYHDKSASVSVASDFGVTYTFAGLTNDAKTISGTLKWTCLDPS